VALPAPAPTTVYAGEPRLRFRDALVIGVSQSAQSPDVVAVLQAAGSHGSPTVVIASLADLRARARAKDHGDGPAVGNQLERAVAEVDHEVERPAVMRLEGCEPDTVKPLGDFLPLEVRQVHDDDVPPAGHSYIWRVELRQEQRIDPIATVEVLLDGVESLEDVSAKLTIRAPCCPGYRCGVRSGRHERLSEDTVLGSGQLVFQLALPLRGGCLEELVPQGDDSRGIR
jgi:hypothetical protein